MSQIDLPFEVGRTIEARSFELGFRGAWFRCKITKIFNKGRALFYDLEYLDFTEEGIHTTKVFQKRLAENENILMVRPIRPRQSHENEEGCGGEEEEEEEVVVVHGLWKVGDLVDWWKDDCYWSGTVLEVREEVETVKIELVPEPYGEGKSYDAMFKDLVPSLEWSLEDGWIVPFSKVGEKRQCAKLMKLPNEGAEETREEEKQRPTKKLVGDEDLALNIMESESIEAAVMDLEEQIVRIEWIKEMLLLNSDNSTWIYEDYPPPSS
ncbi:PREDICTED: uncharacterized protein LOC106315755 isoform X3 [Brassica oleracea var. oleracea]|uniref:uncharacterized protein LOC106315755 isoform X3 n=1 Tax=Brassica oleracea var. oleracea TaxID=109376 RepID=UPI0006A71EBF|nr:PREDICTED: uncharacterized protein LOC106315755 isoform X3 [Brassica oleracea var. oleracea]